MDYELGTISNTKQRATGPSAATVLCRLLAQTTRVHTLVDNLKCKGFSGAKRAKQLYGI